MADKKLPTGYQSIQDRSKPKTGDNVAGDLSNRESLANMFSFSKDGKLGLLGQDKITLPITEKPKRKQGTTMSIYLSEEDANFLFGMESATGMNHSSAIRWALNQIYNRMDSEEVEQIREKGERVRKAESNKKRSKESKKG